MRTLLLFAAAAVVILLYSCVSPDVRSPETHAPANREGAEDYRAGIALIQQGAYEQACAFAQEQARIAGGTPSAPVAWVWARALFELGRSAEAELIVSRALDADAEPYWSAYLQHELFRILDLSYRERLGPDLSRSGFEYPLIAHPAVPERVPAEVVQKARYHIASYAAGQAVEAIAAGDTARFDAYLALVDHVVETGLGRSTTSSGTAGSSISSLRCSSISQTVLFCPRVRS